MTWWLALDTSDDEIALNWVQQLAGLVDGFKIGLELVSAAGTSIVGKVVEAGLPVFLDVKLADIPNTVQLAAANYARLGANFLSVHASAGRAMLTAAVEGAGDACGVLAVTVLTSLTRIQLDEVGFAGGPAVTVTRLANLASAAGCRGVVCAAQEAAIVRRVDPNLLRVTPGIRWEEDANDQARVSTPEAAIGGGSQVLVVGRPITGTTDHVEKARQLNQRLVQIGNVATPIGEDVTPQPPAISPEQRAAALAKAGEARRVRAEVKELLKIGSITFAELLARADTDATIGGLKVATVLASMPGTGKVKAKRLMETHTIAGNRRLRGLGERQRGALLEEFS